MWPNLFGPGWPWMALAVLGLWVAMFVPLAVALCVAARRDAERESIALPELSVWHRYEEGDLTHAEFARLMAALRQKPYGRDFSLGRGVLTQEASRI
ncbi:MAG TPA: hypothetical protein VFP86_17350 [bacterium]|nr:hypothetical protein [bacterium]